MLIPCGDNVVDIDDISCMVQDSYTILGVSKIEYKVFTKSSRGQHVISIPEKDAELLLNEIKYRCLLERSKRDVLPLRDIR